MKKLYVGVFATILIIVIISTFQDLSAMQFDPGNPCDPDALYGEEFACPLDTDVIYLLIGGVGLYFVSKLGLLK